MTDSPFLDRIGEIADELRKVARSDEHTEATAADTLGACMEKMSQRLYAMIADYEPAAGTSAYQMIADTATAQVEATETLIHMVAATVLSVLIDEEGGGRSNISFSPKDMDEMHRRYEMEATHDGMLTSVSIKPRPGMFDSLMLSAKPEPGNTDYVPMPPREANLESKPEADMLEGEHEAEAKPQAAEHHYDRPLWAARINGKLYPASDRQAAEIKVRRAADTEIATVENRFCYHPECPASGCTHAEVASDD